MTATIIAECGLNAGGSLDIAKRMVDAAKECGADIVKFQTFSPWLIPETHPARDAVIAAALSDEDTIKVASHCLDVGIEFLSTPGDVRSLKFLVDACNVKRIKIGSDDMLNWPLLDAAAKTGLPLIVSTGMANVIEMLQCCQFIRARTSHVITLLQCTSLYPCVPEFVNLTAMKRMLECGASFVGYSDHTSGTLACVAAAALGASVIEKHFMLDDGDPIDAAVSVWPPEFADMVVEIREVETMLGDGRKVHRPEEDEARRTLRKVVEGV